MQSFSTSETNLFNLFKQNVGRMSPIDASGLFITSGNMYDAYAPTNYQYKNNPVWKNWLKIVNLYAEEFGLPYPVAVVPFDIAAETWILAIDWSLKESRLRGNPIHETYIFSALNIAVHFKWGDYYNDAKAPS